MSDIVERLNKRTVRSVPANWQDGRECPECGVGANRPKCFYDMGGSCPRHDPDNYEPSPYVTAPDPVCAEAAATITALREEVERLRNDVSVLDGICGTRANELTALRQRVVEWHAARNATLAEPVADVRKSETFRAALNRLANAEDALAGDARALVNEMETTK